MSDDTIYRKAAIDAIAEMGFQKTSTVKAILCRLETLPSAQRTGRWIKNDNDTYSCDQCHSWIPNEQHYYARYCIFCGARMEEGDTE